MPHKGCPFHCSFCDQNKITGQQHVPTAEEVLRTAEEQAKYLGKRISFTEIAFFGGSFTMIDPIIMENLLKAAQTAVQQYGYKGIRLSTRPDGISDSILRLLRQYGVTTIELGAQSMNADVLRLNGRGHTPEQVEEASRAIHEYGFQLGLQMMTGLPGDSEEQARETCVKLYSLSPEYVRIYPTLVLPHTALARWFQEGNYQPQTLEEAVSLCAELIVQFESHGCRVIRAGLHDETGVRVDHIAGPYHPAFGELCRSRIFRNRLESRLQKAGAYHVHVAPQDLSLSVGQKKQNVRYFEEKGYCVKLIADPLMKRGDFQIK